MSTVNGADYVYQNYTFSFKEGEMRRDLRIIPIDDNIVESDETYTLFIQISPDPFGRVRPGENQNITIKIYDDDCKEIAAYALTS